VGAGGPAVLIAITGVKLQTTEWCGGEVVGVVFPLAGKHYRAFRFPVQLGQVMKLGKLFSGSRNGEIEVELEAGACVPLREVSLKEMRKLTRGKLRGMPLRRGPWYEVYAD